jgi:hypothetical protein
MPLYPCGDSSVCLCAFRVSVSLYVFHLSVCLCASVFPSVYAHSACPSAYVHPVSPSALCESRLSVYICAFRLSVCLFASRLSVCLMEAARTSETSVDIQLRTRQYIPEDSELHKNLDQNKWKLRQRSTTGLEHYRLYTLLRQVDNCHRLLQHEVN